jgi:hypothetical protein
MKGLTMSEIENDGLDGRLSALTTVAMAFIAAMPPEVAERIALHIEREIDYRDEDDNPSAHWQESRDRTLAAFLGIAKAAASS